MPNIIPVTDLQMPEVQPYTCLTDARFRNRLEPEKGIFIAESPKVIKVALASGHKAISLLTEEKHIEGQAAEIIETLGDIPIYTGSRELLAQITGYELTRGVLCAMQRPLLPSVELLCQTSRRIVIMDNVVNSTNTGAIFRAAAALGIDAALLTPTCCDPLNRRSVRVSMGTVFQLPWTYLTDNIRNDFDTLRQNGYKTVAMALTPNAISINDPALQKEERLAIIMGTEGDGLSADTLSLCDYIVKIPMSHGVDSLNVAAAASIAFWELSAKDETQD